MDAIRELGKTNEVVDLLRHIPYVRPSPSDREVQGMLFVYNKPRHTPLR